MMCSVFQMCKWSLPGCSQVRVGPPPTSVQIRLHLARGSPAHGPQHGFREKPPAPSSPSGQAPSGPVLNPPPQQLPEFARLVICPLGSLWGGKLQV